MNTDMLKGKNDDTDRSAESRIDEVFEELGTESYEDSMRDGYGLSPEGWRQRYIQYADRIVRMLEDAAVPPLLSRLRDISAKWPFRCHERSVILFALKQIGTTEADSLLMDVLHDPNARELDRELIVEMMGRSASTCAATFLCGVVQDNNVKNIGLRLAALRTLRSIGPAALQSRKGMKIAKSFRKRVISLRLGDYARQGERTRFQKGLSLSEQDAKEKINLMAFFVPFVSSR